MEQYFVESFRDSWKIKYDGSYVGIFSTREAAIGWAIERAHNANARGERASVLTRGYDGLLRVEWTTPEVRQTKIISVVQSAPASSIGQHKGVSTV